MARTKISTVAKDLNVALSTVTDFLRSKNIEVDDNPNTRIDDAAVELLMQKFSTDMTAKRRAEKFSSDRQKEKEKEPQPKPETKPAAPEEVAIKAPVIQGPKIMGHINLDKNGNPTKEAPKAPEKPAEEPKTEAHKVTPAQAETPKPQPQQVKAPAEPKPAETPKASEKAAKAPVEAVKVEKPAPVAPEAPKAAEKASKAESAAPAPQVTIPKEKPQNSPAEKPVQPSKPNKPMAETPEKNQEKPENTGSKPSQPEEEEIFTLGTHAPRPSLNVIGKIDLNTLNQSTRPKKKSKEERHKERMSKNQGANAAAGNGGAQGGAQGDRKKRKRIGGKEKIDIEKSGQQANGGHNEGGNSRRDDRRRRDEKAPKKEARRQPQHVEVSDEDVQKQVKETLARLTGKGNAQKKAVKWRKEKREAASNRAQEAAELEAAESKTLKLTEFVTANDLASMMDVPINQVIATCMNLGVMVSINQRLDAETINIVADEFGYKTEYVSAEVVEAIAQDEDTEEDLVARPPIVTVMGHVDHGKTSLLDYIRKANVIAGEAGGITQHIGAYNVKLSDGRHITFLDTPGHEAFTAMRARGAKVTDLCIIIVAADDSVMPQTVEAINHASAAGVPIVFAINKIDKPHANPEKIKEELAAMNYLVEDWGGKYQSQDISAKQGIGVPELMEKVLLEAELLDLKANPNRNATGSIIESSLDKGRGYVATVLVQNGTLKVGDVVLAGTHFGRIKAMFNERNQRIKEAGPATPALVLGLNGAPTAGDTFNVMETEQEAREIANKREQLQRELGLRTKKILTLEDIGRRRAIGNFQELNIIVKGDVDGSIEALSDSLIKLSTEEIQVNVLHKAVGEISESDVVLAAASDAIIIGFQVRPSVAARRAAERDGVEIRLYSVIYQAIEEVKDAMAGMLAPEIKEEIIGSAEVLETYHISKVGTIAGAIVRDGKIKRGCKVRLIRDGIVRYTGDLGSLKRFKDDAKEVLTGYDCGMSIAGYNDIKVGDIIEGYEEVSVNRTL